MIALQATGLAVAGTSTIEIDLDVEAGGIVGLIGPNGSGKSTTLLAVAGLAPMTGTTVVNGTDVSTLPPHKRGLGWTPQQHGLPPRQRVSDILGPSQSHRGPASLAEVIERLDIGELMNRRAGTLSGGQSQRIAIGRALLAAKVVLLDEPTAAQDADGAMQIRQMIKAHARAGGTVVVVAHQPVDAYALASELLVLEKGRIVQRGTPPDLATKPATAYVAAVVGATVLRGEVSGHTLLGPWGELTVSDSVADGPVTAVVAPGAVTLHRSAPAGSARNVIVGTVSSLFDDPAGVRVTVEANPSVVALVTRESARALKLAVGEPVVASIKANEIRVVAG